MNSSDPEVEHSARANVAVQKVGVLAVSTSDGGLVTYDRNGTI